MAVYLTNCIQCLDTVGWVIGRVLRAATACCKMTEWFDEGV